MKLIFFFIVVVIPLLVSAKDDVNTKSPKVVDLIKNISEEIQKSIGDTVNKPIDENVRATNAIYNLILKVIMKKLTYQIDVPVIGKPGGALYVENGTIFGANETYINIDAPKNGFNMDNLTVFIPSLDIYADNYVITNLGIEGIVLNGEGPLHIYLENVQVYGKMEISFESLKFVVKSITSLQFYMENSKFELENLGSSGEAISSLLNDIASKLLSTLVRSASNDLKLILDTAEGRCSDSNVEVLCSLIGTLLTYLKNNM